MGVDLVGGLRKNAVILTAFYALRSIKESLITSQSHQTPNLDLIPQLECCSCNRKLNPQLDNLLNEQRECHFESHLQTILGGVLRQIYHINNTMGLDVV